MKIDKPFKTYKEQIEILKQKNLIIENEEEAIIALSNYSYYDLINGSKNDLIYDFSTDSFKNGVSFRLLKNIKDLNDDINNLLFKNILLIEKSLKTKVAYLVAEKFGVISYDNYVKEENQDYLNDCNYSSTNRGPSRTNTLSEIRSIYKNPRSGGSSKYYKNNKGYIPPWILVDEIPFGLILNWFKILKNDDNTRISQELLNLPNLSVEELKHFISLSLSLLKDLRNLIAHNNKILSAETRVKFNRKLLKKVLPKQVFSEKEMTSKLIKNYIFLSSCFIVLFLQDTYRTEKFIAEFEKILEYHSLRIDSLLLKRNGSIFNILEIPSNILKRLKVLNNKTKKKNNKII